MHWVKELYAADPAGVAWTQAVSQAVSFDAQAATQVTIVEQSADDEQVVACVQQSASRHASHVALADEKPHAAPASPVVSEQAASHADDSHSSAASRSFTPSGFAFAQLCAQTSSPAAQVASQSSRAMQLASLEQVESTEQHDAVRQASHAATGDVSDPQLDDPPDVSGCPAHVEPSLGTHGASPGGIAVSCEQADASSVVASTTSAAICAPFTRSEAKATRRSYHP
jgi:hypothetical protein